MAGIETRLLIERNGTSFFAGNFAAKSTVHYEFIRGEKRRDEIAR